MIYQRVAVNEASDLQAVLRVVAGAMTTKACAAAPSKAPSKAAAKAEPPLKKRKAEPDPASNGPSGAAVARATANDDKYAKLLQSGVLRLSCGTLAPNSWRLTLM